MPIILENPCLKHQKTPFQIFFFQKRSHSDGKPKRRPSKFEKRFFQAENIHESEGVHFDQMIFFRNVAVPENTLGFFQNY